MCFAFSAVCPRENFGRTMSPCSSSSPFIKLEAGLPPCLKIDFAHYAYREQSVAGMKTLSTNGNSVVSVCCGASLDTLIVGCDMYDEEQHGTDPVDDFDANCPGLASLSVEEKDCVWTSRLERLQ